MTELARATAPRTRQWPMTSEAREAIAAEVDRLAADLTRDRTVEVDEEDAESGVVQFPDLAGERRLDVLRQVLVEAVLDDDPGTAAIGRRVVLRESDGSTATYALVIPGDGDPFQGWVSADSPLGSVVLGRRVGDVVEVDAPAGRWTVTIASIE